MAAKARLACISVDLDSLPHYCRIQGLDESLLDDAARTLIYRVAVPRLRALLDRHGLPGTFFAIGEDLAHPGNAEALREAHRAGIEIGNHSGSHDYGLALRDAAAIAAELALGEEAILGVTGERPVGFRAPGYTLSSALYQALCDRAYRYDSSVFPAVPYYAAKAAVMAALQAVGRPSKAVLDSPRVLLAPTVPYRPDPAQPYRRGSGTVLELPVTVGKGTRIPFIGTFVTVFPELAVRAVYRTLRGVELFNFELHGIDVLDAWDGIPDALVRQQRDLRVPQALKQERLARVFSWLRQDFEVVTLAEAAQRLGSEG